MPDNLQRQKMDGARILARASKQRKGKDITYIPADEKIECEIRDIIRIRPQDFARIKDSLEEWAKQWD